VRKATLASLLRSCPPGVRLNEHLTHDGNVVFRHACKMGLEGIVSKRLGSTYRSGKCKDWLKFKNPGAPAVKQEAESRRGLGDRSVALHEAIFTCRSQPQAKRLSGLAAAHLNADTSPDRDGTHVQGGADGRLDIAEDCLVFVLQRAVGGERLDLGAIADELDAPREDGLVRSFGGRRGGAWRRSCRTACRQERSH
jgi:hypothetical protein